IIDTAPEAAPDTAKIDEDAVDPAEGNVLDNDDLGVDDPHTVEFAGIVAGDTHTGEYGTFTYNEDGTWSYTLDNTDPRVQELDEGDTLTETFEYTVTDSDGDSDTATLTITINGSDDASEITIVPEGSDPEAAGDQGTGEVRDADVAAAGAAQTSGTFNIMASDGIDTVTITADGKDVELSLSELLDLSNNPISIPTEYGVLHLAGYTSTDSDAEDGREFAGEISYRYEITDAQTHGPEGSDTDEELTEGI